MCLTETFNDKKRPTAPPLAEFKKLQGCNFFPICFFICFFVVVLLHCTTVATKQTCFFSFPGWGQGQGSALVSSVFLPAAGPSENTDQKCNGLVLKEKETERGFSRQTQVVNQMLISVHPFLVKIVFSECYNILISKSLYNVSHFIENKNLTCLCLHIYFFFFDSLISFAASPFHDSAKTF